MLIGELIPEGIKYLRNNPQSPYRTAFDHVLVDEYQDLNRAEQRLVDLLANGSLVVIGDEDQSIYSFKHATPRALWNFPDASKHRGGRLGPLPAMPTSGRGDGQRIDLAQRHPQQPTASADAR